MQFVHNQVTLTQGPAAIAKRLHIHKNILYYRMDKLKELFPIDLNDGHVRLCLQPTMEMMRLEGGGVGWGTSIWQYFFGRFLLSIFAPHINSMFVQGLQLYSGFCPLPDWNKGHLFRVPQNPFLFHLTTAAPGVAYKMLPHS